MVIIQEWINFVKLFLAKPEKSVLLFTQYALCYHKCMKENKRYVTLIILEFVTFVSMVLGITFSIVDVRFMADYPRLSSLPIYMTFTGLSNIFIGLVCLGCAIYRLVTKQNKLHTALFVIKIIALADIAITFIVTATYLSISLGSNWWRLYINNNIFNHFLTPLLAIIPFIILEEYVEIPWKFCFFTFIPLILYGFFYVENVYTHLTPEGETSLTYDIYGFCRFGVPVLILFLIGFLAVSFGFTFLFRQLNKLKDK